MYGNIFNIQRFCTDDGDGIRTLFFFMGCPLRCKWCHNPESQSFSSLISYNVKKCIGCGECKTACDFGCHRIDGGHIFEREKCIACGKCAEACPASALELTGRRYSIAELAEIAARDIDFYAGTGGVTLTGGEPLAQGEFAVELARTLKESGISVNFETCGYCKSDIIERAARYCDAFLYDFKVRFDLYEKYTGASGEIVRKNLNTVSKTNRVILRCPIIDGVNADDEHCDAIAQTARENSIKEIHLLPYHNLGVSKSAFWDLPACEEFAAPSADYLAYMQKRIENQCAAGVRVV